MQAEALPYRPRAVTHGEATAGPPLYTVFAGATHPEHDEELSVVGKERVVWSSGLQMDDDEEEERPAAGSNSSADAAAALRLPADHSWGTRVVQSLHFPAAHARSTAGDPDPGTEPPVRGSVGSAGPVLAALWCSFADAARSTQPERQLCVLQKHCLHVVGQDGEVSSVHLPYSARALWPLLEGVLIERESASEAVDTEEMGDADIDDSMRDEQGRVQVPTLFSLLHPLEELKPVAAVEQSSDEVDVDDPESAPLASLLADTAERVVYSCASQPFVLTFHTQRRVHSLWLIRQSRREIFKRTKLEAHAGGASANVSVAIDPIAPISMNDELEAASRRESMTWQAPHPAPRDQHSPVREIALKPADLPPLSSPAKPPTPGSAAALAAAASAAFVSSHPREAEAAKATTAFYHQFLFRSFVEEHPLAHPSTYHAPTVGVAGVAGFVPPHQMYQQDREDSEIHCELLLERSWVQPDSESPGEHGPCSNVFLACSADNEPLLCMFTERSHVFQAFRLSSSLHSSAVTIDGRIAPAVPRLHLAPAFRCSFQSVVPIYSSLHCSGSGSSTSSPSATLASDPYNFCILALEMDGSLSLYQGERKITGIQIRATVASGGKLLTPAASSTTSAAMQVVPAHVNTQRGGALSAAQTPFKAASGSDSSFASAASIGFTPLDPNSTAAALFMQTPASLSSPAVPSAAAAASSEAAGSIVQLLDPVSNRFSIRTRDGGLYRVSIPARFLSTLVRTCVSSLACSLSTELVSSLRSDVLLLRTRVWQMEQQRAASTSSSSPSTLTEHHEWIAFVLLLRHLLGYDENRAQPSSFAPLAASVQPKGDAAWTKLMSSRFHLSRLSHPTLQHLSASAFALESDSTSSSGSDEGLPRLDFSGLQLATSSAALIAELPACFLCLHLVYEELKLPLGGGVGSTPASRLAAQVLKPLSIVLAARDYLDVYTRELGGRPGVWNVSAGDVGQWGRHRSDGSSSANAVPSPPPSIHAFLLQRLHSASSGSAPAVYPLPIVANSQASSSASAAAAGKGVHNFLLSTSLEEPFAWSRKLLLFYDLLTAPDGEQPTQPQPQQLEQLALVPAAAAAPARQSSLALPSPRVVLSDCINSPYALPVIESKQIEAQRSLLSARTWNIQSASASFVAPTPSATPHAVRQLFPSAAAASAALTTPHASPTLMALPSPSLMLSPLLTPLFPTPLAPSATSSRMHQQRRVQAMQLRSVMSSAAKASAANSAAASRVTTPQSLIKRPPGKAKGRVSFGANTTSATPQAHYAASPAAADVNASTISNAASMRSMMLAPSAMEFPLFAPSGSLRAPPRFLSHSAAESIVLAMVLEDFTSEHLQMLAPGLALPLLEALKHVRENPPLNIQPAAAEIAAVTAAAANASGANARGAVAMWPKEAYTLIGREDLGQMFASMHGGSASSSSSSGSGGAGSNAAASSDPERQLDEELEIAAGRPADVELEEPASAHGLSGSAVARMAPEPPDLDGTLLVERSTSLRFGRDQRLKEVRHLLRSDRVLCVSLDPAIRQRLEAMGGGGGAEVAEENQLRLGIVAKRALSLPVARGMYTLASIQPSLAESLPLPPILLKGRVPPLNSLIDLDLGPHSVQASLNAESLQWPEFHNAVAAALRIQPAAQQPAHAADSFNGSGHAEGADAHTELSNAHMRDDAAAAASAPSSSSHQITRTWIVYNRPTLHSSSTPAPASASPAAMVGGLSYAHAGFLFGLGLTGHLACLTPSDFFWYLSQGHEPTAIAMLLGMAACKRGSGDTTVSKMLTLHIPALLPANFSEMSIPSPVQSCALLGIGLLYQSSAHRLMCELLLNEIGRRPGATRADDSFLSERENYAFSAAMGLGLLLLGRGGDPAAMSGLADLAVEKKLASYIHGGKDLVAAQSNRNAGASSTGGGNGPGMAGSAALLDDDEDDTGGDGVGWMHSSPLPRVTSLGNGVGQGNAAGNGSGAPRNAQHYAEAALSGKNPRVKEGSLVNTDVTSAGSTLALALMYLQSNNSLVAARFTLPDSLFSLDFIRSDLVFLRVLARNLVGWAGVPEESTESIMSKHMPALMGKYVMSLRFYMPKWSASAAAKKAAAAKQRKTQARKPKPAVERKHDAENDAMRDDSDAEDAGADDDDDDASDDEDAHDDQDIDGFTAPASLPPGSLNSNPDSGSAMREQDIDFATLRQTYLHVIAGNCFSVGLKFAGTAHPRVVAMLTRILKALRAVAKRRGGGDFVMHTMAGLNPLAQLHKVDRGTLDAALVAVSLALGLVLAGTGNLAAMRIFRGLLKARPDKQTAAGWHQSVSMALGLLFLSGGRATIDTGYGAPSPTPASQARIAYLLLSLYPHLSQNVGEHRYYLSVYRHLYVLATVPRSLETIDVDTGRACYVPLEVVVAVPPSAASAKERAQQQQQQVQSRLKTRRLRFITPCLLPSYDAILSIRIVSPRFHALSLHFPSAASARDPSAGSARGMVHPSSLHRIFVKKKLGVEGYEKDALGQRSFHHRVFPSSLALLSRALTEASEEDEGAAVEVKDELKAFLKSFSTDPRLRSFTHLFLREHAASTVLANDTAALDSYLSAVVYECLREEKFFQMIAIYLELFPLASPDAGAAGAAGASAGAAGAGASSRIALESKLSSPDCVWSLLMLREYYERFRVAQQTQRSYNNRGEVDAASAASAAAQRTKQAKPFHLLPLAEGSASVVLSDPETASSAAECSSSLQPSSRASPPLLSAAFLSAMVLRVDSAFEANAELQADFANYVRAQCADAPAAGIQASVQRSSGSGSGKGRVETVHPLLGSLLLWWRLPAPSLLSEGLALLRQQGPGAPPSTRLLLAGLLWPSMPPVAIRAMLAAISSA